MLFVRCGVLYSERPTSPERLAFAGRDPQAATRRSRPFHDAPPPAPPLDAAHRGRRSLARFARPDAPRPVRRQQRVTRPRR